MQSTSQSISDRKPAVNLFSGSRFLVLPKRINLLSPDLPAFKTQENKLIDDWVRYMDDLHSQKFVLVNHEEKIAKVYRRTFNSRYTKGGRKKIKRRIKQRMGDYYFKSGIMVGVTFNHKKWSRFESWRDVGQFSRRLMDEINKYRLRKGLKKRLSYVTLPEEQKDTGWAHQHFYFPGLNYLIDKEVLSKLWPYGSTNIHKMGGHNGASYCCKYITKMDGKDLMMSYMRHFGIRIFNMSRTFKTQGGRAVTNWCYLKPEKNKSLDDQVRDLKLLGYFIENIEISGLTVSKMGWGRPPPLKRVGLTALNVSEDQAGGTLGRIREGSNDT